MSVNASGNTREPARPDVNKTFDAQKEARINEIAGLPVPEAFERLKTAEYLSNPDLMYKTISRAFSYRKKDTLTFARNYLRSPLTEVVGGRVISRLKEFTVAKRIFEIFPEDATPMLVSLYERGDAVTKGNIIQAAGNMAGGGEIRKLMIRALDDTSAYEEENPDSPGEPLRICDVAYNQLVLRYTITNVLRTISPLHSIATRDYHIAILKGML